MPAKPGEKTREKPRVKAREKILDLIAASPKITTEGLAGQIGITRRGIEKMEADCEAQGVPRPVLRHETNGLWVEFAYRVTGADTGETPETTQKTTQKILAILRQNPSASRREIAAILKYITEDGVKYHLDKLKSEGRIRRVGPAKGGKWQVLETDDE